MNRGTSVAEVLAFARADGVWQYDEIATRVCASSPFAGPSPLHTLAWETRHQPTRDAVKRKRLNNLREAARPVSFEPELPPSGRVGLEVTADFLRLRLHHEGRTVVRRTSLGHPPWYFFRNSSPDPPGRLLGPQLATIRAGTEQIWWLPFSALVEQGRFLRMQECDRLTKQLETNAFYLFVSHRWLDLADPDPEGRQAAAIGWRLVSAAIEAIWVRAARGASVRLRSTFGHAVVGPHGSDLAESMVVNLLASLDEDEFAKLVGEVASFDDIEEGGVRHAREDIGLAKLRARLAPAAALQGLLSRVRLWYDFSCVPQHPRTRLEQAQYEFLLRRLNLVQMLGRTAVLLDDLADYFGRGWCSYESSLAHGYSSRSLDVWGGSGGGAQTLYSEPVEEIFMRVLDDRLHLIWRAILDTELFRVQTAEVCMARLGLVTTRPEDRAIVYGLLRELGVPNFIHIDDGEVLSGVFPVPLVDGEAAVIGKHIRHRDAATEPEERLIELPVVTAKMPALGPRGLPAWDEFDDEPNHQRTGAYPRTAHVAVVASCEGEAILFAHWVREHRQALQEALQVRIGSLSWLACDVAPVGHFALGTLSVRTVQRDSWIVVATATALAVGFATQILIETLWSAGIDHAELEVSAGDALKVGTTGGTLKVYAKSDMAAAPNKGIATELLRFAIDDPKLRLTHEALFRPQFMQHLGISREIAKRD